MRPNHSKVFAAAIMAAMASTASAGAIVNKDAVAPFHKAPAPAKRGEATAPERLLCSPYRFKRSALWPYRGKNKTQRAHLSSGFASF